MIDTQEFRISAPGATRPGWGGIALYCIPTLGVAAPSMFVQFYFLNFATDVLLLAPLSVGLLFASGRVWDAVSDPMVGYWSDRTRSRFGRRRSWMLASALPLGAVSIIIWSPPESLSGNALIAWIVVSIFAFYTVYTVYTVPQLALGAELSPVPRERGRAFGARQIAVTLGMLLAFVFAAPLLVDAETARASARLLAWGGALVTIVAIVSCTLALPEERRDYAGRGAASPVGAIRDVLRNPHARLLLFVYFIESMGTGAIGMLIPFLLDDVMELPELTGPILGLTFVLAILSIPVWVRLATRYEKRHLWLGAMLASCVGFGLMLFMAKGTWPLMLVSATIVGLCQSCGSVLGYSIKAEIVDFDEYQTGERKEGAYFSAWNFVFKTAFGITLMLTGYVLEFAGYVPNVEQTETVKTALLSLYALYPFVCYMIGAAIFSRFSLGEEEHREIRAELDRRAGRSV